MQETLIPFWVRKMPWKARLPILVFLGSAGGSGGKESACNAGDLDLVPGLERSPGEGKGYPLQYSCLENPFGQRSLKGYSPFGSQRVRHDWATKHITYTLYDYILCIANINIYIHNLIWVFYVCFKATTLLIFPLIQKIHLSEAFAFFVMFYPLEQYNKLVNNTNMIE